MKQGDGIDPSGLVSSLPIREPPALTVEALYYQGAQPEKNPGQADAMARRDAGGGRRIGGAIRG